MHLIFFSRARLLRWALCAPCTFAPDCPALGTHGRRPQLSRPERLLPAAGVKVEEARGLLESAVHFAESAFKAVWDGSIQEQPAKLQGGAVCGGLAASVWGVGCARSHAQGGLMHRRPVQAERSWPTLRLLCACLPPPACACCSRGGRHGADAAAAAEPASAGRHSDAAPGPRPGDLPSAVWRAPRPGRTRRGQVGLEAWGGRDAGLSGGGVFWGAGWDALLAECCLLAVVRRPCPPCFLPALPQGV